MTARPNDALRKDYEKAVREIRTFVSVMQQEARPAEEIARAAHAERRRLAEHFKKLTPEPARSRVSQRTKAAYGDHLGPTIEILRAKGKSWEEIIESATRPGNLDWTDPAC